MQISDALAVAHPRRRPHDVLLTIYSRVGQIGGVMALSLYHSFGGIRDSKIFCAIQSVVDFKASAEARHWEHPRMYTIIAVNFKLR